MVAALTKYRKLRIAWSVGWGLFWLLLIVFWIRSHWLVEQIVLPVTRTNSVAFGSMPGAFMVGHTNEIPQKYWHSQPAPKWLQYFDDENDPWSDTVKFRLDDGVLVLPYWFGTVLLTAIVALPWLPLPRQFSLRTLLIGTTLVAVMLGLVMWAVGG